MKPLSQEEIDNRLGYALDEEYEILSASANKTPSSNSIPMRIDELVEEYAAKLDYLIAMRNLVKKNIKINFYE